MSEDVSIIVRTKDRPQFLRRAIESISGQTFTNWQCAIVNDGGDPAAIEQVLATVPDALRGKFHILHHPESRGRWQSANAGVLATLSRYIVLHDDDDSWDPAFLEKAVTYLGAHPSRDGVVSRIEIIWESEDDGTLVETGREVFQPHLPELLLSDALLFNRFVPIAFVYRRTLHEELGLYDENLPVVGDWDFNLKVLSRGPLEFLPGAPLAFWHQRRGATGPGGNSVTANMDDHRQYDARIRDAALRDYVGDQGLGLALYLTSFIDRRFVEVEAGIRAEIREASLPARVWRRVRRPWRPDGPQTPEVPKRKLSP